MDPHIAKCITPEECDILIERFQTSDPSFANEARRRKLDLLARGGVARFGAQTDAELEALTAVLAYEEVLFVKHGRRVGASYTWRMIRNKGIIRAVESAVKKSHDPAGYALLQQMGLQHLSFESVVVRHPESFSAEALAIAQKRLDATNIA